MKLKIDILLKPLFSILNISKTFYSFWIYLVTVKGIGESGCLLCRLGANSPISLFFYIETEYCLVLHRSQFLFSFISKQNTVWFYTVHNLSFLLYPNRILFDFTPFAISFSFVTKMITVWFYAVHDFPFLL